jgi:hypothetical protein
VSGGRGFESRPGGDKASRETDMKNVLRVVLTILMYSGVLVFLVPYFTGRITTGIALMIIGAGGAVVCGLLRCYLTEGDCHPLARIGRDW